MNDNVHLSSNLKSNINFKDQENYYNNILKEKDLLPLSEKEKKETALTYNNLGFSKYMQVKFDEAVGDYSKALEIDETLAVAYYNRGTIFYRMGCFPEAHKDFKIAVSLDSSNNEFKKGLEACEKYTS